MDVEQMEAESNHNLRVQVATVQFRHRSSCDRTQYFSTSNFKLQHRRWQDGHGLSTEGARTENHNP